MVWFKLPTQIIENKTINAMLCMAWNYVEKHKMKLGKHIAFTA